MCASIQSLEGSPLADSACLDVHARPGFELEHDHEPRRLEDRVRVHAAALSIPPSLDDHSGSSRSTGTDSPRSRAPADLDRRAQHHRAPATILPPRGPSAAPSRSIPSSSASNAGPSTVTLRLARRERAAAPDRSASAREPAGQASRLRAKPVRVRRARDGRDRCLHDQQPPADRAPGIPDGPQRRKGRSALVETSHHQR